MFVHDLWYNPRRTTRMSRPTRATSGRTTRRPASNCILMGYEGGIEFVSAEHAGTITYTATSVTTTASTTPTGTSPSRIFTRGSRCRVSITCTCTRWQCSGDQQAWGMYHGILQDHGRGDGTDGKLNNLLCRANPTAAHYKGANVNQDMNTVSVRGQAFIDWLAAWSTDRRRRDRLRGEAPRRPAG